MVTAHNIDLPMAAIADFCSKWKIREFALFGSVLTDEFRPDSDIDVLVTLEEGDHWDLMDLVNAQLELEDILDRRVDIVDRAAIEVSENRWKRHNILSAAQTVYAA